MLVDTSVENKYEYVLVRWCKMVRCECCKWGELRCSILLETSEIDVDKSLRRETDEISDECWLLLAIFLITFPQCHSVTVLQCHSIIVKCHSVKCQSVSKTWRWLTFPLSPAGGEDSDGHQHGAALLPPTVGRHHREDVAPGVSATSRDQCWAVIWWDGTGPHFIFSKNVLEISQPK